jgi:hypothetical protein
MDGRRSMMMIAPDNFYNHEDSPDHGERQRMWKRILQTLPMPRRRVFVIRDIRSFVYGMAATVVLGFAALGVAQFIHQLRQSSEGEQILAYQEAIRRFEAAVTATAQTSGDEGNGRMASWNKEVDMVEQAIQDLRIDIRQKGSTPLKAAKLLKLYALKLQILQSIVDNSGVLS